MFSSGISLSSSLIYKITKVKLIKSIFKLSKISNGIFEFSCGICFSLSDGSEVNHFRS